MGEPTDEQIKEFWKKVFGKDKVEFHLALGGDLCVYQRGKWIEEDKEFTLHFLGYGIETINLENLFKHAVPNRISEITFIYASNCASCDIEDLEGNFFEAHIDTESIEEAWAKAGLCLFWAISEVIKNE